MKFFTAAIVQAALAAVASATYINYTAITGYFLQDENNTNATTFDYVSRKGFMQNCQANFQVINQLWTYQSYLPLGLPVHH